MNELVLAITAADLPQNVRYCALWEGRKAPPETLCIESMLEERLIEIRRQHMRWAYETGADNNFQELLKCGVNPSMWWTSLIYERHPKLNPNLYVIFKLTCVEIWLREKGARTLLVVGHAPKVSKSLRRLCSTLGIGFTAEERPGENKKKTSLKTKVYELTPAPIRTCARFGYWLWSVRTKLRPVKKLTKLPPCQQNNAPTASIVTYFPNLDMQAAGAGRFHSRYWESLHNALNEEARTERPNGPHFVRWLFLFFQAPGIDLQYAKELRDGFVKHGADGLSFNFLEEFLTTGDIVRALLRYLRLTWQSLRLERRFANKCVTSGSNLNFWPWLRWQWAESLRGWRCLERCLFNLAFERYCRMAGPQRWTLFPLENCPWERMLTEAARHVPGNGPVFGAQHSTIRPTDFRYFDDPRTFNFADCAAFQPDKIAGNGASACRQWQTNGMPTERLVHVEALRYIYLNERKPIAQKESMPPDRDEPVEPFAPKRLLIATSFFRDETDAHLALVQEAMQAGLLKNWQLTLKAHPYLHPSEWLESLPQSWKEQIFVSGEPLERELCPGTAVWASNSTTVALEAALSGLPVMVMAASNDFDLCPIQDVQGLMRTATLADVEKALGLLRPLKLAPDYLDLDPRLPRWRELLGLKKN